MVKAYLLGTAAAGFVRTTGDGNKDGVLHRGLLTEALGDLKAVHARHANIQQQDLGLTGSGGFEGRGPCVARFGVVPP
jgi:hypothetical protein